jgi:release factor glutamine methyltransferase
MTAGDQLVQATRQLEAAGIATARLDALVLMEDVTGQQRSWLLAHPEYELSGRSVTKLKKLLSARARHLPLAYVRGQTEFYGRTFLINQQVLEPRPESETMIDLLKKVVSERFWGPQTARQRLPIRLADVGTGSGALGITAKLELPELTVELLDIDESALQVAKMNVDLFTINISVTQSDLLAQSNPPYDILLCNLPYVPDDYHINTAASHEPRLAIFGGSDGLDYYRQLYEQIANMDQKPLYILTEALPPQHAGLETLARRHQYRLIEQIDFIQVFGLAAK